MDHLERPTRTLIIDNYDDDDSVESLENSRLYSAARKWWKRGYNVVPQSFDGAKHPGVKWKELQKRRVTEGELLDWYRRFASGVGFITGEISGVIVVETDGPEGEALLAEFERVHGPLPKTLTICSGSGRGLHRHFKHPGHRVKTTANESVKIDVRGDGGFCVLPPSLHKSGGRYEVVRDAEPAQLPRGLLDFIEAAAARASGSGAASAPFMGARHRVCGIASALGNNLHDRLPVNATNVALVQSMLDALPTQYATEFDLWLRTGFALHTFDEGQVGLALWKHFSKRCPKKACLTNFEKRWANLSRDYDGKKIGIGWLRWTAVAHDWRPPCRWDRSTKIAS
jgi:Bifunctional DNA primase/polymerase, N-terminal/Primase C terminal 2 (PriCT-2)